MAVFFESIELVLDEVPHSASVNMAVDEVLLREITAPVLRFYRWLRPSISFGYFEEFGPIETAHPDREPVRRWTGGGVVLHGDDLTFSLIVPRADPFLKFSTGASYRGIHECIAKILQESGVGAEVAPVHGPKISQACFENAAQFDLVVESRKVVGGAQRRNRSGMLHQGSIQTMDLPAGFAEKLALGVARKISPRDLLAEELGAAEVLAAAKYATPEWLRKW